MRWEITGADRETGEDTSIVLDAPTREAAELRANRSGILVANVTATTVTQARPVPPLAATTTAPMYPQQINVGVAVQNHAKGTSGFGIAALVLGIIAALVCWIPFLGLLTLPFALIGLLCAVVGFAVSLIGGRSGVGMPVAGGALCSIALVIAIMATGAATGIVGASVSRASETANRVRCASHMRQIGQALLLYANDHGTHPPTLAALGKSDPELVEEKIFACPSGGISNYVYLATAPASETAIILYEPLSNHDGDGANFLQRDGTVLWESGAEAKRLIAGR